MKQLVLLAFLWILSHSAASQQKEFQWRLGMSGGYANYYGDLTPRAVSGFTDTKAIHQIFYFNENYAAQPSFKATLERQLSASTGLSLHYGQYYFAMSDRYIERDGSLYLENPNFSRSLNFRNRTREVGLAMVFRSDNDRLLSSSALIAPYFSLGAGIIHFDVWGDLLDEKGEKYDNTIPGIIHDGTYETSLPEWETERDGGYGKVALTASLGLGFRIKLTKNFEAFAQSDFILTFTDFLDDVGGRYREEYSSSFQAYASRPGFNTVDPERPYRGNPNGAPDWIFYHGIGLKFNFGASNKTFTGPRVSTGFTPPPSPITTSLLDREESEPKTGQFTRTGESAFHANQYFFWRSVQKLDTIKYENQLLVWEQEIQKRQNLLTQCDIRSKELTDIRRELEGRHNFLKEDQNLPENDKAEFLRSSEQNLFDIRYSMDSIERRESELQRQIDSLHQRKNTHQLVPTVILVHSDTTFVQILEPGADTVFRQGFRTRVYGENQEQPGEAGSNYNQEAATKLNKVETETLLAQTFSQSGVSSPSELEPDRMKQLEEENKYLRYDRDRLLAESQRQSKTPKSRRESVTHTRTNDRTISHSVEREPPQVNEPERRRRWWWPFGAAAAVGTVAVLSQDNQAEMEDQAGDGPGGENGHISQQTSDTLPMATMPPTAVAAVSQNQPGPEEMTIATESDTAETVHEPGMDAPSVSEILPEHRRALPENFFQPVESLFFDPNQRIPSDKEAEKLRQLAEFVRDHEGFGLLLTGYTDNTGSLSYNLQLARDRMDNVANVLEEKYGIHKDFLRYESGGTVLRGPEFADNLLDRKVEVKLVVLNDKED
jgi:outer membrane protein OmpA-like peptidoglycan-associated protein